MVVVVVHDYCIVGGVDGVEMIIILSMMIVVGSVRRCWIVGTVVVMMVNHCCPLLFVVCDI